ncbi:hypothetical protein [Luteimonas terrae]|uniref:hypothetical protein n=1 Tax=Luteimonas terrae TaxID=1530191 RepID=UPI0014051B63|nr:hypothetical protein [Luteimonas terrae]
MLPENVATLTEARARLFEIGGVLMDQYERGARFFARIGLVVRDRVRSLQHGIHDLDPRSPQQ